MNFTIFKQYLEIIKPKIILGNLIPVIGGFFLAAKGDIHFFLLLNVLIGTFLVIASGCVFNNIIDKDIDKKMHRTRNRALPKKLVSINFAFSYGTFLGVLGFLYLFFFTNILVFFLNFIGFLIYVFLYSKYMKPNFVYSTIIGGFSGSLPPIIGYSVVENKINLCTLFLFLIFLCWQIIHFYSISIFRFHDYKSADIPVFSVVNGIRKTQYNILLYIIFFIFFSIFLYILNVTNYLYFLSISVLGSCWFILGILTINCFSYTLWSKIMFFISIGVIFFFSFLISVCYVS
ncbi:heme o synthase [Buchnera aphidicola]|uniref:heme o synthase n=1 Tax=Buchnera aphidicola TaxID=9 RepID=UPI0031B6BE8C